MAKNSKQAINMYSPKDKKSRKRHTKLKNKHTSEKPNIGQGRG